MEIEKLKQISPAPATFKGAHDGGTVQVQFAHHVHPTRGAGWNNQREVLMFGLVLAKLLNRSLVSCDACRVPTKQA